MPPGTVQYQLAVGHVASGASLEQGASPTYPAALLATCPLPGQVQALLIMDKSGMVTAERVAGERAALAIRPAADHALGRRCRRHQP